MEFDGVLADAQADSDLLVRLQEKISYNTILSILLMQIYNALLRRYLIARGVDPSQFDLTDQWESLQDFDPNLQLADLYHRFQALEPQLRARLSQGDLQALHQEAGLSDFREHFDQFLDQFGHLSDSTVDFTSIPWRESPDLTLRMVCEFTPRETKQVRKISLQDLKYRRLSFRYLCSIYQRARQLRLYREMHSSQYTYTLMLLRDHFHTLGERLTIGGLLFSWQDIFFLYLEELRNWVNGDADGNDLAALVAERKDEMERGPELIRLTWHDPELLKPEITALYHKPLQVENWDKVLLDLTLASRASALADRLDEFDIPILVMTGDNDRIVPTADSIWLAGELPIAELVVILKAGYVPHEEKPDAFVHAVTNFIK